MVSTELIRIVPDLPLEVSLVLKPLISLFLNLMLPMAFFKGQFKGSIEHVKPSSELEEGIDHL